MNDGLMISKHRAMVGLEFGVENRNNREETIASAILSTTDTYGLAWGRTHFSGLRRKVSDMLNNLKRLRELCVRPNSKEDVRQ
jgi:hypothetical protein